MDKLKSYTFSGILFVLILGSLSHFFYEWSDHNFIIGLFSPVNESVWEHMKLVFFPMLLYSFIAIPKLKGAYPCAASAWLSGILAGTLLIPVIFYTYTTILGYNLLILDIGTFILCVILAFYLAYRLTLSCSMQKYTGFLYIAAALFAVSFMIFSYYPLPLGL